MKTDIYRPMSNSWADKKFDYEKKYSNFLGCYALQSTHGWEKVKINRLYLKPSECLNKCSMNGFTFGGIFLADRCLCFNGKLDIFADISACNLKCPANVGEFCGGANTGVVYQVCRPGKYGKYCDLPCECWNYKPCHVETGECFYKECRDGERFKGPKCYDKWPEGQSKSWIVRIGQPAHQSCREGSYGLYCQEKCNCASGGCDRVSGACTNPNCQKEFFGRRCDKRNRCYRNPCSNAGKCINDYPDFYCQCDTQRWVGSNCELDNPCISYPCKNGGKCELQETSYYCKCDKNWGGTNCEKDASKGDKRTEYIGCVQDGNSREHEERSLSEKVLSGVSKVEDCVVKCRAKGYTFAGLQKADNGQMECHCGDDYGRYGTTSEKFCTDKCQDGKRCGGRRRFSIYTTCPIGHYDYSCMKSCRCGGKRACRLQSGICMYPTCTPGFQGESCEIEMHERPTMYKTCLYYYRMSFFTLTGLLILPTLILVINLLLSSFNPTI